MVDSACAGRTKTNNNSKDATRVVNFLKNGKPVNCGLNMMRYMAGTTSKVKNVEAINPEIIADAKGGHRVEEEKANGKSPATVVAVVKRIGRILLATASLSAFSTETPF